MKPLVLLDVDGVVNAWGIRTDADAALYSAQVLNVEPWRVIITAETLRVLERIVGGAHEVLWLSSWRHLANRILPHLPFVPAGTVWDAVTDGGSFATDHGVEWKLSSALANETVQAALAEGRPVVWFEDIGWHRGSRFAHWSKAEIAVTGIKAVDILPDGWLMMKHLAGTGLV